MLMSLKRRIKTADQSDLPETVSSELTSDCASDWFASQLKSAKASVAAPGVNGR